MNLCPVIFSDKREFEKNKKITPQKSSLYLGTFSWNLNKMKLYK